MTLTLQQALDADALEAREARADTLGAEYYRETLDSAIPVFRESNLLSMGAFPVTEVQKPYAKVSRAARIVDLGPAEFGESGIGGAFNRIDIDSNQEVIFRVHENIEVTDIDQQAYANPDGGVSVDLFRESGAAAAEKIKQRMNTALVAGLGKCVGISGRATTTYASGDDWSVPSAAKREVVKAIKSKFPGLNAPVDKIAMGINHVDNGTLYSEVGTTATEQIASIEKLLSGGIYPHSDWPSTKAYFWPQTKTVLEVRVLEALRIIPLARGDEADRMRMRTSFAIHAHKPEAIIELTGISVAEA